MPHFLCVHAPALCIQERKTYRSKKYYKMLYKKNRSVGIRRKFGDGKQIWSFGGIRCNLSKDVLYHNFGEDVLKKLDCGMSEDDVRAWVLAAIK